MIETQMQSDQVESGRLQNLVDRLEAMGQKKVGLDKAINAFKREIVASDFVTVRFDIYQDCPVMIIDLDYDRLGLNAEAIRYSFQQRSDKTYAIEPPSAGLSGTDREPRAGFSTGLFRFRIADYEDSTKTRGYPNLEVLNNRFAAMDDEAVTQYLKRFFDNVAQDCLETAIQLAEK